MVRRFYNISALQLAGAALTSALLAAPAPLRADEIPGEFTAVRPIGMGDAYTAVADDEDSVWTNPAGVGRVRKARSRSTLNLTKVPDLIVGANGNTSNFYDAFKGSGKDGVEAVLADANLGDKPLYARAALFPVALFDIDRNTPMAFGLVSNTTVQALVPKATPNQAQVSAISDLGSTLTLGWANNNNRLNFGLSVRPIIRYAYENVMPSADLINRTALEQDLKNESNKSQGLGTDFGMMYTVADFWFPTIGVAVLNLPLGCKAGYLNPYTETRQTVCGDVFHGSIANPDALSTVDPTDIRVGASITPRLGRDVNLRFAIDAHNIPAGTAAGVLRAPKESRRVR